MKKIILISLAVIVFGCKKQRGDLVSRTTYTPSYLIGAWDRSAMNDTVYTGTVIDSISYQKVFVNQTLIFSTASNGIIKNQLINFTYSTVDAPGRTITFDGQQTITWRIVKVSDTKIRLIRHQNNVGANNIGYDDEYSKE